MNKVKLEAARKVAVALGKVRSKLKKDVEKEQAALGSTGPVELNGESYDTLADAQDWYGCGGISEEEYKAIEAEFEKRKTATSPELEILKEMKSYYDQLVDSMKAEVEKLEQDNGQEN